MSNTSYAMQRCMQYPTCVTLKWRTVVICIVVNLKKPLLWCAVLACCAGVLCHAVVWWATQSVDPRYHRWVSQWVLLLVTCHGLIYCE